MLRKILIFVPMMFGVIMGSLAILSPDIIGRLLEGLPSGLGEGAMQPIIVELVLIAMLAGAFKLSKTETAL